jgi:sigma-E factor negative regulatory protein RseB
LKNKRPSCIAPFSRVVATLLLLVLPVSVFAESHTAQQWVMRMDHAVEYTNYQGRMVYMRRDHIGTFQIYHRVDGDDVEERLVRMDGDGAEIIRRKNEVICIFPKQRAVFVDMRGKLNRMQNPLQASLPGYTPSMTSNYNIVVTGTARIAGRETIRIGIKPKDVFRYGYQLWLDKKTAMPLKAQLIDASREIPLEELLFTSIELDKPVTLDMLESSLEIESFTWVRATDSQVVGRSPAAQINWQATDLPSGFMLTAAYLEYTNSIAQPRMHLVYSDSIAMVSVFVDVGVAASEQVEGVSSMGAANAYSVMSEGWLVTAMGEVPAQTVRRIAVSVRRDEKP